MAIREAPDRHQHGHRTIAIGRLLRSRSLSHRGDTRTIRSLSKLKIAIRRPRRFVEELHDRGSIEPRSRRDQGDQGAYVVEAPPFDHTAIDGDSGSRLTHDRGPIVAKIVVFFRLI